MERSNIEKFGELIELEFKKEKPYTILKKGLIKFLMLCPGYTV